MESHERRKMLTPERVAMWITIAGVVYGFVAFYVQAKDLPPRVDALEKTVTVHCAAQVQFEKDLSQNMVDIKGMLRDLVNERRRSHAPGQ